jgi:hypothetical protein
LQLHPRICVIADLPVYLGTDLVTEHEAAFLVEYHFDLFQLMKIKIALAEK